MPWSVVSAHGAPSITAHSKIKDDDGSVNSWLYYWAISNLLKARTEKEQWQPVSFCTKQGNAIWSTALDGILLDHGL